MVMLVIAKTKTKTKTASRNVGISLPKRVAKMNEAVLDVQASFVTTSRLTRQDRRLRQSASRLTMMTLSVTRR